MVSLAELRSACEAAGLPTYGSKETLEQRLNEHAAKQLAQEESQAMAEESVTQPEAGLVPADLDAAQTTPVMQVSARVSFAEDGRNTKAGLIIPTETEAKILTQAISEPTAGKISMEEAQRNLAEIKSRYPQLNVRLDEQQEVFIFEGGLQGRVTTTAHQPLKALIHNISGVAPGYITAHHAAIAARTTIAGAQGNVGDKFMVYQ